MLHIGEDLLTCDMAEFYHIYITDWQNPPLPISYLATLAVGLAEYSRIYKKISKSKLTMTQAIQALIVDRLSVLVWQNTKDGSKGRNHPESLYKKLEGLDEQKEELLSFTTPEDFEEWRKNKMR